MMLEDVILRKIRALTRTIHAIIERKLKSLTLIQKMRPQRLFARERFLNLFFSEIMLLEIG